MNLSSLGKEEKLLLAGAAGFLVLVGAIASLRGKPQPVVAATAEEKKVVVHVAGEVVHPGVYEFPAGARVHEAIEASGGAREGGDLNALNLARPLEDGEQVIVPSRASPAVSAAGGDPHQGTAAPSASTGKINLNQATKEELMQLPGIGPALAERIVQHRQTQGAFQAPDELMRVSGIGAKKFEALKDLVTVY